MKQTYHKEDSVTGLSPIQLDSYKSLRKLVSEKLRDAIRRGELKPGQRLMEIQLAEALGVSRTPVREAMRELEMEGFVVMLPRRGAYVADMSLKDISQVFEIRTVMEELAAGLAAQRITEEELSELEQLLVVMRRYIREANQEEFLKTDVRFHDVLYGASRNKWLREIINNLHDHLMRFRSISTLYPGRVEQVWEEHRKLVEAIAAHNTEEARRLAAVHMGNAEKTLLKEIEENEDAARDLRDRTEEKK